MFIHSLPFDIHKRLHALRMSSRTVKIVLVDAALFGVAVAVSLKVRVGPR